MQNLPRLGWLVTDTGNLEHPYRIEADADTGTFDTDQEAAQYVAYSAMQGEPQAVSAVRWLKENCPSEIEAMNKLIDRQTAGRIAQL